MPGSILADATRASKAGGASGTPTLKEWLVGAPSEWQGLVAGAAYPAGVAGVAPAADANGRGRAFVGVCRARLALAIDAGLMAEVYVACEEFARLARRVGATETKGSAGAEALGRLARIYLAHIDLSRRARLDEHRSSLESIAREGDGWEQAHAHSALGLLAVYARDLAAAETAFLLSESLFSEAADEPARLKVLIRRVMVLRMSGRSEEAASLCEAGHAACVLVGTRASGSLLVFLSTLGAMARERGAFAEALRALREAAKRARTLPDSAATAFARYQYGATLTAAGRAKEGILWLKEAARLQKILDPTARVGCLVDLLRALRSVGEVEGALRVLVELRASRLRDLDLSERIEIESECAAFLAEVRDASGLGALVDAWGDKKTPGTLAHEASALPELAAALAKARAELVALEAVLERAQVHRLSEKCEASQPCLDILIDGPHSRVIVRRTEAPLVSSVCRSFAHGTQFTRVLGHLIERAAAGSRAVERKSLVALLESETHGTGEALRKATQRTLQAFGEIGLLSSSEGPVGVLKLPAAATWTVIEFPQVK